MYVWQKAGAIGCRRLVHCMVADDWKTNFFGRKNDDSRIHAGAALQCASAVL